VSPSETSDATTRAITLFTTLLDSGDAREERLNAFFAGLDGPDNDDEVLLFAGLFNLAGYLLARLAVAEGAPRDNWLERGREILARLAVELPEDSV